MSASVNRANRVSLAGVGHDVRAIGMASVAALAPYDPTISLRWGSVIGALALVTSLTKIRLRGAGVALGLLSSLVVLSLFWTVERDDTTLAAKNYLCALAIFLAVRTVARDRKAIRLVGFGFVGGCLYTVYVLVRQNDLAVNTLFDAALTRYAIAGLNGNYIAYSMVTGIAVIVLLWSTKHPSPLLALLFLSMIGVMLVGVTLAETRGAYFGVALIALWLLLVRVVKSALLLKALYWVVALVTVVIVSGIGDQFIRSNVTKSIRETGDLNGRLLAWPVAREQFLAHPWLGTGAGTFPEFNTLHIAAHNVFLDLATGVGVMGAVLFLLVVHRALVWDTKTILPRQRTLLVGVITLASAPSLLSGFWSESPAFWLTLALFTSVGLNAAHDQSETPGVRDVPGTLDGLGEHLIEPEPELPGR